VSEKEKERRKGSRASVEAGRRQRRCLVMSKEEGEQGRGKAECGAEWRWHGAPVAGSAVAVAGRSARTRLMAAEREKARVEGEG
jgi:hypothetical protein